MTIEQRPELSRFVDPAIIAPWKFHWHLSKGFIPLWLFCFACFLEMTFLMAWSAGKPLLIPLAIALGGSLLPFLFIVGLLEVFIRFGHNRKPVFQFEDDKIILGLTPYSPAIRWEDLLKFQFEPIPKLPGMTKLILSFHMLRKNKKRVRRTTLVVENPVQVRELLDYLQKRKTEAANNFEIAVLNSPSPLFETPPHYLSSFGLAMLGFFLVIQGMACVGGVLNHGHHDSDSDSRLSPEQITRIQSFMHHHFSNYAEFWHFFLTLGLSLIIVGVGLTIVALQLGKMDRQLKSKPCPAR